MMTELSKIQNSGTVKCNNNYIWGTMTHELENVDIKVILS